MAFCQKSKTAKGQKNNNFAIFAKKQKDAELFFLLLYFFIAEQIPICLCEEEVKR